MDLQQIRRMRFSAQRLARPSADVPETVRWMGALQAQDYQGALWAIAVRTDGATLHDIEQAIEHRQIVRTWPMRGTLHFIAPELLRPVLRLCGPRIKQRTAARERQLGIDDDVLGKAGKVITAEIREHGARTRGELYAAMASANLQPEGQRGIHILGQLSRDLLLCFGPHRGRQPTFVLLDDWLPSAGDVPDDAAAGELALRYFRSHGPATIHDFAWWSNLTVTTARAALDTCRAQLESDDLNGRKYWFDPRATASRATGLWLLPPFDELVVGYTDRTTVAEPASLGRVVPGSNGLFRACVVDGRGELRGLWRKSATTRGGAVDVEPFGPPLPDAELQRAVHAYSRYVGPR